MKYKFLILVIIFSLSVKTFADLAIEELDLEGLEDEVIIDQVDLSSIPTESISQTTIQNEQKEAFKNQNKSLNKIYTKNYIPMKNFLGSYDSVWKMISKEINKYELKYINKILGVIKTRWIDNTYERRLLDPEQSILSSRFSLLIKVLRPKKVSHIGVKMTIYKREQIITERFPDWYPVESEGILEKTIFYRVSRLLDIEQVLFNKTKKLEFTDYEKDVNRNELKKEDILKLDEEYSLDANLDDIEEISLDDIFED